MCDIGWSGWIVVLIYLLLLAGVGIGTLFGLARVVWRVLKKGSDASKLP